MYEGYFGLRAAPFQVTPDPSLLLLTEAHQEALAAILYGIMARKGFVTITGEIGVGKTTVLRHALDQVADNNTDVIHLVQPVTSALELLRTLRAELAPEGQQFAEMHDTSRIVADIQEQLLLRLQQGRSVVVAIDEAQTMPYEALEALRLLSNFETRTAKLLQVVLVGQPELDEILERPEMRPLNQRIAVRARIGPLSMEDSRRYVEHRISAAGGSVAELFTPGALRVLLREAQGYPRRLNIMCDNALMNAFGHESHRVTTRIAREALEPLTYRPPKSSRVELRPVEREPIVMESELPRRRRPSMVMIAAATGLTALAAVVALTPPWQNRMHEAFAQAWAVGRAAVEPPSETQQASVEKTPTSEMPSERSPAEPPATQPSAVAESPPPAPTPAPPSSPPSTTTAAAPPQNAAPPPAPTPMPAPAPETAVPQLAAIAPAAAPASKIGDRTKHVRVVRRGDTVADMCREVYNRRCGPEEMKKIREANPGIRDLSRVMVGQLIAFPVSR
jgi:general secretion pathway protein A